MAFKSFKNCRVFAGAEPRVSEAAVGPEPERGVHVRHQAGPPRLPFSPVLRILL